jgi:GNAT superfamily N-acetyltransferase
VGSDPRFHLVEVPSIGVRVSLCKDDKEAAHAYLYLFKNDLHEEPVGYLEDAFVEENLRGQGIGKELVLRVISEASSRGCYKLVAASRYSRTNVHRLYERLGLRTHGIEFRLDLK